MSSTDFFKPDTSPPTEFYFSVNFSGMTGLIDSSFQEVSGLKATFGVEERKEGGENRFVHSFPTPPKLENLVLKRCLMPNSKLDNGVVILSIISNLALETFIFHYWALVIKKYWRLGM